MSAIFSALVIFSVDPRERPDGASPCWRQSAVPALFYAGAAALKPTGLVFLGLHFVITSIAGYLETLNARATLRRAGWIAAWGLIFLSPWLSLYSPYYVIALLNPIDQSSTVLPELRGFPSLASLFSSAPTFFGSPRSLYTLLAAGLLSCAILAVSRGCLEPCSRRSWIALATTLAAAGGSYFFWVVIGPRLHESLAALRFSIPALIGTTSAASPLWAMLSSPIATATVLLFLFVPPTHERVSSQGCFTKERNLPICTVGPAARLSGASCRRSGTEEQRSRYSKFPRTDSTRRSFAGLGSHSVPAGLQS
jgi:hypothetical protein